MDHPRPERGRSAAPRIAAVCALLVLAIGLVFGRTTYHDFTNYDDNEYVYENPQVSNGLTAGGIGWAFTHRYASNWHPLTWLSHMLDSQLYGMNAGGHHLTSVLLHAVTAALLFLVLQQMTGQTWAGAFAAALFAVHPLRVESVAWVAERKDVLSGLFFMLTLGAYLGYARRPASLSRYIWVVGAYVLGLMSKPMLVTLPALLLLLDHWPLGRMRRHSLVTLVKEKVPLSALAAASCAITLWAQQDTLVPSGKLPFAWRLGNAAVAYADYVGKFFYPAKLAVFYPHPGLALPAGKLAAAALVLTVVTVGAVKMRRDHPCLAVGWLWYAGMLVPVAGLVQAGDQAMADRYTYLPQIGLGVAVAWTGATASRRGIHHGWTSGAALLSLALMAGIAWRQTGYWRNSETLFTHAMASTLKSPVAYNNLGVVLASRGEVDEAIAHYRQALDIKPDYVEAHNNLGNILASRGEVDEAIAHYRKALAINPDYEKAHNNIGNIMAARGQLDEAVTHFRRALEIKPGFGEAHNNLGNALAARGQIDEAIAHYRQALEIKPGFGEAHNNLGVALAGRGRIDEAIVHYRRALAIKPDYERAYINLGDALAVSGRTDEAIAHYRKALGLAMQQGNVIQAETLRKKIARYEAGGPNL